MADAGALGIYPPSTVRIDMGGWVQDWAFECVALEDHPATGTCVAILVNHNRIVIYRYEHAQQQDDGTWIFHGREDFTITAGPPHPPSPQ